MAKRNRAPSRRYQTTLAQLGHPPSPTPWARPCAPERQGDELACPCGLRWPEDEDKPACPRGNRSVA